MVGIGVVAFVVVVLLFAFVVLLFVVVMLVVELGLLVLVGFPERQRDFWLHLLL